jgi:hypothetical protein
LNETNQCLYNASDVILWSEDVNIINLFIYGLFNSAVSSTDYIARNSRIVSESIIGKNVGGSSPGKT